MENHYISQIKASREKLEASIFNMGKVESETKKLMAELSEEIQKVEKLRFVEMMQNAPRGF